MKRGFSLVELLVVVAVLILLATIAIPNFVEAQLKAQRAKTVADLAELSKGIEAYFIDYREYPATDHSLASAGGRGANRSVTDARDPFLLLPTFRHRADPSDPLAQLTTPVAYIPAYPADPFSTARSATFSYSVPDESVLGESITQRGWIAWSVGASGDVPIGGNVYAGLVELSNVGVAGATRVHSDVYNPRTYVPSPALIAASYDPTNGSRSPGIIYRIKN